MSRLTELHIKDFKRISTIDIRPSGGSMTTISGANESGKSSTLDAISVLLQGKAAKIPIPVRKGAKKAIITGTIQADTWDAFNGTLRVERHISAKGTWSIKITSNDVPQKAPETMLRTIFPHAIDPVELVNMPPAERAILLKQIMGLDFAELDEDREYAYNQRTETNRIHKSLQAQLASTPTYPDAPKEEVSIAGLTAELRKRKETNDTRTEHLQRVAKIGEQIVIARNTIAAYQADIEDLRLELTENEQMQKKLVASQPFQADEEETLQQIASASETNKQVQANRDHSNLEDRLCLADTKRDELTNQIEQIDENKAAQLSAIKLPVDGLSFTENDIFYRGLPFNDKQLSAEELLKVSFSMAIAANPNLKDILIHNGNDLDRKNLKIIEEMAKEHGVHVWLERIEGGRGAILIEDGMVADLEDIGEI